MIHDITCRYQRRRAPCQQNTPIGSGLFGPLIATNITTKLGKNVTRGGVHGTEDKPSS